MTEPKKKRHHYVPVFYLQGFVDPDDDTHVWIYDKEGGEISRAGPRDAGLEKYYYSYTTAEGERDSSSVEGALEKIDNLAAPLLRKLLAGESLSRDERYGFSNLMALLTARGPVHHRNYETIAAAGAKFMVEIAATKGRFDDMPEVKELIASGEFDVGVNPQISLENLAVAQTVVPVLDRMTWLVIAARGRYRFVSSDNPVVYADPTHDPQSTVGVGLLSPNIEVTFPLSRDLALVASWQGPEYGFARIRGSEQLVKITNRWTIAGAKRFVYASQRSDGLMKLVSKFKGSGVPRVEVVSPPSMATRKEEPAP